MIFKEAKMNAQEFWNVIGDYNNQTLFIQIVLLAILVLAIVLSYLKKLNWAAKIALGIANIFIGIAFFAMYGTEPIQIFFAMPLFIISGILFLYEAWKNKDDELNKPSVFQMILLLLYAVYPLVSVAFGATFPQMVTHIMPCPVASLSITVYSGYKRKNRVLLALLTVWGFTGIKSIFFNAYEDLILLICGFYGLFVLIKMFQNGKVEK